MTTMKWKVFVFIAIVMVCGCMYLGQYIGINCVFTNCTSPNKFYPVVNVDNFKDMLSTEDFDVEDDDVLVFLHIQKTGGTFFGRNLVKNLNIDPPCICVRGKKKCECKTQNRKVWLFSRYSTGWVCGLHADWTELQVCVDKKMDEKEGIHRKRRYHFITYLRDPIKRYISEWKHIVRGATWKNALLVCNGRQATLEEVPFCYEDSDWKNVSLEEFLACPHNLANNRQTRMLADLTLVNCYNTTGLSQERRDSIMLESAKRNLQNMSFFGITEFQVQSQALFEKTFQLPFFDDFEQRKSRVSDMVHVNVFYDKIKHQNRLDIQLYEYAKDLFFARLKTLNVSLSSSSSTIT